MHRRIALALDRLAVALAVTVMLPTPAAAQVVPIRTRPAIAVKSPGLLSPVAQFSWMPATTDDQAASLFDEDDTRFNFLNQASLTGGGDAGAAFIEVVSDYAGPIRVSLASVIAAADGASADRDENIQRFLSGGGTAVLSATFAGPTVTWGAQNFVTILVSPRIGFTMPALGTSTDDQTSNGDLGGDLLLNWMFSRGKLGLYAHARGAWVTGGDKFYESIGLADAEPFSYSRTAVGLTIPALNVAVLWSKTTSGPPSLRDVGTGGQISLVVARSRR